MRGIIATMLLCTTLSFGQEAQDDRRNFQAVVGFTTIGVGIGVMTAESFGLAQDKTKVGMIALAAGCFFILLDILNNQETKTTEGDDDEH